MKAIIYKGKFIVVKPIPQKDIRDGLKIKTTRPIDKYSENLTVTDIHKGQKIYQLPNVPRNIITGVYISE